MVSRVKNPAMFDTVKVGVKVRFQVQKMGGALVVTDLQHKVKSLVLSRRCGSPGGRSDRSCSATSTVVMFGLMCLHTYALDHIFFSETRASGSGTLRLAVVISM